MKKLSLIIPVYKQEKTIKRDIQDVLSVLNALKIPYEIIPVIDGMLDRSFEEARMVRSPDVQVVGYKTNHGKGYAVRYGFAHATGDVIGFMDAGGDLKPEALLVMLAQFEFQDADVVLGSKRHPDSKVDYPRYRKILSWGYQQIVKILFGLNVTDTQVGMKIYKRKLLEDVLPRLLVKQFAFDIEMLAVAYHLGYRKIYESPVEINFLFSKTSIVWSKLSRVIYNMITDTLAVFYRLKIKRYYDNASKRKWRFDPELNFRINIG
ncbi:glycosyltransferase family 2 protein [Patescibacteria group bacterium]|nr:glycosyltransferase family 2 protein [Patescibacteria group bacterium]MBU1472769.1 glycosyltransferase family 2 protein [Patescibacteria group bacterium]MBU2460035.1 glycosyltransferase family 2 protein [Patescibacteria group bacterium]MBU2544307.1 glycosyltransferase family 2 protein [Patescibacteria group bacterium]